MRIHCATQSLLLLVPALIASVALAQPDVGELPSGTQIKTDFERACEGDRNIPNIRFLEASAALAENVVNDFCSGSFDEERVVRGVQRVLDAIAMEASSQGLQTDPSLEALAIQVGLLVETRRVAPSIATQQLGDFYQVSIGGENRARARSGPCTEVARRVAGDDEVECGDYFDEIETIYEHAQTVYSVTTAAPLARSLTALDRQWDSFLERSKAQTPWEVAYNGWRFQREHGDARGFVAPPDRQYIILHPSIAIDYTDGATDGEQMQEAIVIDIAGVNWWGPKARWLSGFAFHTAYSDRAEVDDWGYGVSLFFRSNYTLGVTWRDDEVGLFVSVDLLKPLNDASRIVSAFRD